MSIETLSKLGSVKKLLAGRSDDTVDKLHSATTTSLLVILATVITTGLFVGEPIQCWLPAEFPENRVGYVKQYCWIKNTYYIPPDEVIPENIKERMETEVTYYQWIPLILLFMALLFKIPNIIWTHFHRKCGLNISCLSEMIDGCIGLSKNAREERVNHLADVIKYWLSVRNYEIAPERNNRLHTAYRNTRQSFLVRLYIFVKGLYLLNVIGQMFLLKVFLDMDFPKLGTDLWNIFSESTYWLESKRFPRLTLCDFTIRQLQNIQRYSVQCVLPINLFSEKMFVILWFWLLLLSIVTTYNLLYWMWSLLYRKNNFTKIKNHMNLKKIPNDRINRMKRRLGDDGCFVIRMVSINSESVAVKYLLDGLCQTFEPTQANVQEYEETNVKRLKETSLHETEC